jgi:nucleosome binding factor SPN SPT16 subunit
MCFALICLEAGEDQTVLDEAVLQEKIKRMSADGLTAGTVYEEVVGFMEASPETFQAHLVMFAMIGAGGSGDASSDTDASSVS